MPARIGNRELGNDLLRTIFHHLDAGATRPQIRALVKDAQGRGISNEAIAQLRKHHRTLRRSQGYAIGPNTRQKLRATPDSPLTPVSQLSDRIGAPVGRLPPSRRPTPSIRGALGRRIEGVGQIEIVQFEKTEDGRRSGESEIRQFKTGGDAPSLEQQVAEAAEEGFDTRPRESLGRGGPKFARLAVIPNVPDL